MQYIKFHPCENNKLQHTGLELVHCGDSLGRVVADGRTCMWGCSTGPATGRASWRARPASSCHSRYPVRCTPEHPWSTAKTTIADRQTKGEILPVDTLRVAVPTENCNKALDSHHANSRLKTFKNIHITQNGKEVFYSQSTNKCFVEIFTQHISDKGKSEFFFFLLVLLNHRQSGKGGSRGIWIRTWSHQHSEKLGSWCSRLYSRNSNITLMIMHIHQSRIISVWGEQKHRVGETGGGESGGHWNTNRKKTRYSTQL